MRRGIFHRLDFQAVVTYNTFATRLCENETNLKVIQAIMGHRSIETTMDIYAEATDRKKQETFEHLTKLDLLWEEFILSGLTTKSVCWQQSDNKFISRMK